MSGAGNSMSASFLQLVLDSWSKIALEGRRMEIDQQALQMYELDQKGQQSRQELASQIKAIKSMTEQERHKAMGSALKRFQKEVDKLTERAKFAEKSFLSLYSSLFEAPDPVPALHSAKILLEKSQRLEAELKDAKKKNELFEEEFKTLKNQEVTIKRLEDDIKLLKEQNTANIAEATHEQKEKFEVQKHEIMQKFKQREDELLGQLQVSRQALEDAHSAYEQVQSVLYSIRSQEEKSLATQDLEFKLLLEDLERSQSSLIVLRKKNEELQSELNSLKSKSVVAGVESMETVRSLEEKQDSLLKANTKLRQEIQSAKDSHSEKVEAIENLVKEKDAHIEALKNQISHLEKQMSEFPSHEEANALKRKIHMLQALQFNAFEEDLEESLESTEMEKLLLKKNRHIESEITRLKNDLLVSESKVDMSEAECKSLQEEVDSLKSLVQKLELDLERLSSSSEIVPSQIFHTTPKASTPLAKLANAGSSGDEDLSRLEIVLGQRDRYRKRVEGLEGELADLSVRLDQSQNELSKLRAENVKLFEKLRFVQSYRPGSNRISSNADIESQSSYSKGAVDDTELKYQKLYDQATNPFTDFNRRQKQQRYTQLSTTEKLTLKTANVCLGSKRLRTILFFYAIALHVLVFVTLWSHAVVNHCDPSHALSPKSKFQDE